MRMRTTLDIDVALLRAAEQRAAATDRTLTSLVETALRELLRRESSVEDYRLDWDPIEGGVQKGVDLDDRDALWSRMEERG